MITIQELLYSRGLPKGAKAKLVRHKDTSQNLFEMYKEDRAKFFKYQAQQGSDKFKNAEYIVSFLGQEGTRARFVGVSKILSEVEIREEYLVDHPDKKGKLYCYNTQELDEFNDLEEKVIIDWGKGALSWVQNIENKKQVIEISPGLQYKTFRDYFDVYLTYSELKEIVREEYPDWKRMLSATKGVYLISDTQTGKLYVGSAYGENGIWGRWVSYAKSGHGGNKRSIELLGNDIKRAEYFCFSILMILPRTVTEDEAISKEKLFKRKLGTNAFGLNDN